MASPGIPEICTVKESVIRGFSLNSKSQQELYKQIQKKSTFADLKNRTAFSMESLSSLDGSSSNEEQLLLLKPMIHNKLVAQIPMISYDSPSGVLSCNTIFLTVPGEGTKETFSELVFRAAELSSKDFESSFKERISVSREKINEYLQNNFLNDTASKGIDCGGIFVDFKALIQKTQSVLPWNTADILSFAEEILDSFNQVYMEKLTDSSAVFFKKEEIIPIYETLGNFLIDRVIDELEMPASIKRKSASERMNTQSVLDPHPKSEFPEYIQNATMEMKDELGIKDYSDKNPRALALIEFVIKFSKIAEKKYKDDWKAQLEKVIAEFKNSVSYPTQGWKSLIRFVTIGESLEYHPEIWNEVLKSDEMFNSVWHRTDDMYYVFVGRNIDTFISLVVGMQELSGSELWKALALKTLIEDKEKNTALNKLFKDEKFVREYGRLLRKVYINMSPWYLRWLLALPFEGTLNFFFRIIKENIRSSQESIAIRNKDKIESTQRKKMKERHDTLEANQSEFTKQSICDTVEGYYFHRKQIPLYSEIFSNFQDMTEAEFNKALNRAKYRLIPWKKGTKLHENVIFFSSEYARKNIGKIQSVLDEMELTCKDRAMEKEDDSIILKIKAVRSTFDKKGKMSGILSSKNNDLVETDPYQKFKKEIDSLKT